MLYRQGHAEVQAEGFTESADFGIAASAKAFKGLIDGLYSRKIEAVIRELATNAFDGHMAAGSIAPFEVHLPTVLSPTFWIRDYGVGMSHDLMMRRYTTLFDSTKDGTSPDAAGRLYTKKGNITAKEAKRHPMKPIAANKQVGMLGLGSKSFFAYTDSCTITVWQDGEVRLYTVYMGPNGIPKISLAGQAASDEPTGVKVEFAVKTRDFPAFAKAAGRVFKGFPVMPNGLPIAVRDEINTPSLEMGKFWKAYPKSYLPDGGFYAKQGCVLYPIDLIQIDDMAEEDDDAVDEHGNPIVKLSETYARFIGLDMTVILDFPIGSLEFDLSRERLAYSEDTVKALKSRWSEFMADLDVVVAKTFAKDTTGWQRAISAQGDLFSKLGPLFASSPYAVSAKSITTTLLSMFPESRGNWQAKHAFDQIVRLDEKTGGYRTHREKRHNDIKNVTPANTIVVYRDTAKTVLPRIGLLLRTLGMENALIFAKWRLTRENLDKLGNPTVYRVSEMAMPPRATGVREPGAKGFGGGGFDRVKVIDGNGYRVPNDDDDLDAHLFGFLHRGEVYNPFPDHQPNYGHADVIALHHLSVLNDGPAISYVNRRSNDKEGRWDHLPLFYDMVDRFAETLTKGQIADFIAVWNYEQFRHTPESSALSALSRAELRERNPITALGRFHKRRALVRDTTQWITMRDSVALAKVRNDIIAIAHQMGIEVLPPMNGAADICVPTLDKKWSKAVAYINSLSRYDDKAMQYRPAVRRAIIKEAMGSC
jgi:hypothetical protein